MREVLIQYFGEVLYILLTGKLEIFSAHVNIKALRRSSEKQSVQCQEEQLDIQNDGYLAFDSGLAASYCVTMHGIMRIKLEKLKKKNKNSKAHCLAHGKHLIYTCYNYYY